MKKENPFEQLANLDRTIHEPARLAILTALSSCKSADFLFLQRITGLTKGNLSSHLSKLEENGLINAQKDFIGKQTQTQLTLTTRGKKSIEQHWQSLSALRDDARKWTAELKIQPA
ncbi:MAG: transcriptional regulator [Bacteroidota bacterium]